MLAPPIQLLLTPTSVQTVWLPRLQIFNNGYRMNEGAWHGAESLRDTAHSPSLAAVAHWARRYRCYVCATLLEATADGHIYNSLVLAAPDGRFITHPCGGGGEGSSGGDGGASGMGDGSGSSGSPEPSNKTAGSLCLVRKHRASSLEGFVFRSAGAAGRGGEPWAHVVEVDAAPLLQKRRGCAHAGSGGSGGSGCSGESGGAGVGSTGGVGSSGGAAAGVGGGALQGGSGDPGRAQLRLAFSICYENYCTPPMEAIRVRFTRGVAGRCSRVSCFCRTSCWVT